MDHTGIAYILLAGIWSAYCVLHSVLISTPVTRWIRERFPDRHRYHRLIFNLISILTLLPVAAYTLALQASPLFSWDGYLRWLQALFILAGTALMIAGAANYDFREFIGLSQITRPDACQGLGSDCELNTTGVLGIVRHPWYTAVLLLLWARDLDPADLIVNTVLTIYVIIGTHLEEQKLVAAFGQSYRDYQQTVSMFLPVKWLRSRYRRTSGDTRS